MSVCNQCLLDWIRDKAAIPADLETEGDDATQVPLRWRWSLFTWVTRSRMRSRSASATATGS